MNKNYYDTLFIIRYSNESTLDVCKNHLFNATHKDINLIILNEYPFYKSLMKGFNQSKLYNYKYTFFIDADVLIFKNAISDIYNCISKENIFECQGLIFDKFTGYWRSGGIHSYNNKFIDLLIDTLDSTKHTERPEGNMIRALSKQGYKYKCLNVFTGIHDFYQSESDIYRKGFLHSKKHRHLTTYFLDYWNKNLSDNDFTIIKKGFLDGLDDNHPADLNSSSNVYNNCYSKYRNVPEKIVELSGYENIKPPKDFFLHFPIVGNGHNRKIGFFLYSFFKIISLKIHNYFFYNEYD